MAINWNNPATGVTPAGGVAPMNTITAAFKQQFHDGFNLALQKTESVLSPLITNRGAIQGSSFTINDLGTVEMNPRKFTDRFTETKFDLPEVGTRLVVMDDYDLYVPIEPVDRHRLTAQVDGPYMQMMVAAANRRKDLIIRDALTGIIQRKQDNNLDTYNLANPAVGWKPTPFEKTQNIVATGNLAAPAVGSPAPAPTKAGHLDKATLIKMRALFRRNRADKETVYMLYNADMMASILGDKELTNADYMAIQMLQTGDVGSNWLGFQWVAFEELPAVDLAGDVNTVGAKPYLGALAFTKTALQLGVGQNYTTDIGTRHDLRLVQQLSAQMSFGAGRTNEKKVAMITFDPAM